MNRPLLLGSVAALLAGCATNGDPPGYVAYLDEVDAAFLEVEEDSFVFAAASRIVELRGTWNVLRFEERWPADWAISNTSGDALERLGVQWAWSPDCPAIEGVLIALEAMPRPAIGAPGVDSTPAPEPDDAPEAGAAMERIVLVADGSSYRLFSSGQTLYDPEASGEMAPSIPWWSMELEAGDLSPLALWFEDAMTALEPCWTETPPPPRD